MELNYILLFLAITSPLAVLAGAMRAGASPSWRFAAVLVLTGEVTAEDFRVVLRSVDPDGRAR